MTATRGLRTGLCGVVLAAVYLGLAASAMAGNEPLWVRQLGTAGSDVAFGAATDATGNVYLTGYTTGSLGGPHHGADYTDAWVVKVDAAGHVLWKRQLGTAESDAAYGVATDPAGNVYITGSTQGALGGSYHGGEYDAWVAKLDAAGHVLWKRQLGTTADDGASGVATDAAGNVYLTGYTYGAFGGPNRGDRDAWVAKLDTAGHVAWRQQFGSAGYSGASGIATDAAGNLYISGYTNGALGGPYHGGVYDAWVAKIGAAAGDLRWKRQLGTAAGDVAQGVAIDATGNVYLAGYTGGSLGGPNRGGGDAWVAKYSAAGSRLWIRQFGTAADEGESGVATDPAGNVYLAGYTWGALGGPNRGGPDAWLAKVDAAGHIVWKRQLGTDGGGDDAENALDLATDTAGNVFVTGYTSSPLGGPYRGGFNDAWVAKYSTKP